MKKFILLDIHAIVHRAYHALPSSLTSKSGEPTNAVYGFASILLRILKELKPDYIAAAFDLPGPTFRHVAYERYKAQRPETPSDLESQFGKVREVVAAFEIPIFEKQGFEADDIIGTLVKKFSKEKNIEITIVTGDKDALQLITHGVKVYTMKKGINDTATYDSKAVKERFGIAPSQVIDLKGLMGDPSDNIPGVKGVGEKTALELLKVFKSIDGIYRALKKKDRRISEVLAEKLHSQEEQARFSRQLAEIKKNVPLDVKLSDLKAEDHLNSDRVREIFGKYGFVSLLRRLNGSGDFTANPAPKKKKENKQFSLLDAAVETNPPIPVIASHKEIEKYGKTEIGLIFHEEKIYGVAKKEKQVFRFGNAFLKEKLTRDIFQKSAWQVYDGKSLIRSLRGFGIELGEIKFDLKLATYITDSTRRDFSYTAIAVREGISGGEEQIFSRFFELVDIFENYLKADKLRNVFSKIEMPLVPVLADMEEAGILLDKSFLKELAREVDSRIGRIEKEVYKLSGEEFNLNSSQQLSRILFETLNISVVGLRRTEKGGVISTGASELEKLKDSHPIVPKILEYRELAKLKTTYIDVLPNLVNPETRRIHTTFNQTGTASGRLSSSDPNLQNIPILSKIGREIRKAFIASPGFLLASLDYSQIELRVAAHLADDKKMIEAFQKGVDIHKLTAAEIYNVPLEKVTSELRRAAKTLNFGVLYGMGPVALAESTGMSRTDAKKFIEEYFSDFSGIRNYIEGVKKFAAENGFVETLFGRRRAIPEIHTGNWQGRREAERMAVSHTIQGSATGDIVKIAMIKIYEWIKREELQNLVKMLLQVHDELVFEIKEGEAKEMSERIKSIMEEAAILKVPLKVEIYLGKHWGKG